MYNILLAIYDSKITAYSKEKSGYDLIYINGEKSIDYTLEDLSDKLAYLKKEIADIYNCGIEALEFTYFGEVSDTEKRDLDAGKIKLFLYDSYVVKAYNSLKSIGLLIGNHGINFLGKYYFMRDGKVYKSDSYDLLGYNMSVNELMSSITKE